MWPAFIDVSPSEIARDERSGFTVRVYESIDEGLGFKPVLGQ